MKNLIFLLLAFIVVSCMPYTNPSPMKFQCWMDNKEFFEMVSQEFTNAGFEITQETQNSITGYKADNQFLAQANLYVNVVKIKENVTINVRNETTSLSAKSTVYYSDMQGPSYFQEMFMPVVNNIKNRCSDNVPQSAPPINK